MKLLCILLLSGFTMGHITKNGPSSKNAISKIDSSRLEQCHYRFADGSRCTELIWKPGKFCTRHRGA